MENCTVGVFTMASMAVYGFLPHLWPKSEFADEILQLILTKLTEMLCWCTGEGGDSLG